MNHEHEISRAEANEILSAVANGAKCSDELVTHCLRITGDLSGSRLVWSSSFAGMLRR